MTNLHAIKLYNDYYDLLVNYVSGVLSDRIIAEDIVSKCFHNLLYREGRYNQERQLENLIQDTHYLATTYQKDYKEKGINAVPLSWNDSTIANQFTKIEFLENIRNHIKKLPGSFVEICKLHYLDQMSGEEISKKLKLSPQKVRIALSMAKKQLIARSFDKPSFYFEKTAPIIQVKKDEINAEMINYLSKHPELLNELHHYKFEDLVTALLRDMGYEVHSTPRTRDKGRDIIAVITVPPNNKILTIIECKRHHKQIGIGLVERFLYTLRERDKANAGWMVTTSTFSNEAWKCQQQFKWLLSLKDSDHLKLWCSQYGQWKQSPRPGGLWLPNDPPA